MVCSRGFEGGGLVVVVVERGCGWDYFEGRVERWMQGWAFCSATLPLPVLCFHRVAARQ